MKTVKTTAKIIALSLIISSALSVKAFACPPNVNCEIASAEVEMVNILESKKEFDSIEKELRLEGVIECADTEILVVLDENDEIVYQGSQPVYGGNNAFITRLLTKADYIMSAGGKNFYKIF